MSGNSVERYIDLIKISMSMTNEVEKNKIINEAHQVLRNSKPNTEYINTGYSNNGSVLTSGPSCSSYNIGDGHSRTNIAAYHRDMRSGYLSMLFLPSK